MCFYSERMKENRLLLLFLFEMQLFCTERLSSGKSAELLPSEEDMELQVQLFITCSCDFSFTEISTKAQKRSNGDVFPSKPAVSGERLQEVQSVTHRRC